MPSIEFSLRAQDTYLTDPVDATATTLRLGHDQTLANVRFPGPPFWVVIDPDDPNAREDVLVISQAGTLNTVIRGFTGSPPGTGIDHKAGAPVRMATRDGVRIESFHRIGDTGEPAFANSWANRTPQATFGKAGYAMTPDNLVVMVGNLDSGTINTKAFTLPVGYRPAQEQHYAVDSNSAFGRLDVRVNGDVVPVVGSNTTFSLACSWRADQ